MHFTGDTHYTEKEFSGKRVLTKKSIVIGTCSQQITQSNQSNQGQWISIWSLLLHTNYDN